MRLLRSCLFGLWFLGSSLALVLFGLLLPAERLPRHAVRWSHVVLSGMGLCGMRVEVTGRENLPAGGKMLIASMHQSAFDTLLWLQLLPHCRYIVKAELMRIPLFGRLARQSGQIGVDRAGGAATMRLLLREGGDALAAGHQVVIFPEGTRAPPGKLVPLQPGIAALATRNAPGVIPVLTDSGFCWGRGLFGKRPGVIHVQILPALPAGLPRADLMEQLTALFTAEVERQRGRLNPVDNSVH
jgi:1-acyl-sn-glycerol-3-phosphate acyltransferase